MIFYSTSGKVTHLNGICLICFIVSSGQIILPHEDTQVTRTNNSEKPHENAVPHENPTDFWILLDFVDV